MLNDKTEFLNIGNLPKTLLVLGNGFGLQKVFGVYIRK